MTAEWNPTNDELRAIADNPPSIVPELTVRALARLVLREREAAAAAWAERNGRILELADRAGRTDQAETERDEAEQAERWKAEATTCPPIDRARAKELRDAADWMHAHVGTDTDRVASAVRAYARGLRRRADRIDGWPWACEKCGTTNRISRTEPEACPGCVTAMLNDPDNIARRDDLTARITRGEVQPDTRESLMALFDRHRDGARWWPCAHCDSGPRDDDTTLHVCLCSDRCAAPHCNPLPASPGADPKDT